MPQEGNVITPQLPPILLLILMLDTTIAVHHISQYLVHLLRDSLLKASQIQKITQLLGR